MPEIIKVTDADDIVAVAQLAHEIWNEYYVPLIGQAQVDYMLAHFQSAKIIREQIASGYDYYLVKYDGQNAGYFALIDKPAESSAMLSKIYVKAALRGKGLGRTIIHFAEETCRASGLRQLWLTVNRHNVGSIAFYERVGFSKSGTMSQDIGNGFIMDDFKMTKPL